MKLNIVHYPQAVLRQKAHAVKDFSSELRGFANAMIATMEAKGGIGLAAPQVGVSQRLFILDMCAGKNADELLFTWDGRSVPIDLIMPLVVINPVIQASEDTVLYHEGCLSFPSIRNVPVIRPESLTMEYVDLDEHPHRLSCDNFFARVILHEFDHIEGILFIDRIEEKDLANIQERLNELEEEAVL